MSESDIKDLREEDRILHKRINDLDTEIRETFKDGSRTQVNLLEKLSIMSQLEGIMNSQVGMNSKAIVDVKDVVKENRIEYKKDFEKWEGRLWKFIIGIISAITIPALIYLIRQGG